MLFKQRFLIIITVLIATILCFSFFTPKILNAEDLTPHCMFVPVNTGTLGNGPNETGQMKVPFDLWAHHCEGKYYVFKLVKLPDGYRYWDDTDPYAIKETAPGDGETFEGSGIWNGSGIWKLPADTSFVVDSGIIPSEPFWGKHLEIYLDQGYYQGLMEVYDSAGGSLYASSAAELGPGEVGSPQKPNSYTNLSVNVFTTPEGVRIVQNNVTTYNFKVWNHISTVIVTPGLADGNTIIEQTTVDITITNALGTEWCITDQQMTWSNQYSTFLPPYLPDFIYNGDKITELTDGYDPLTGIYHKIIQINVGAGPWQIHFHPEQNLDSNIPIVVAKERVDTIVGSLSIMTLPGESSSNASEVLLTEDTNINLTGTDSNAQISIGDLTIISAAEGTFDVSKITGEILNSDDVSGLSLDPNAVFQFGIVGEGLSFSEPIQIKIFAGTEFAGQTVNLVRSTDGENWTTDGLLATSAVVDEFGYALFESNKASYFAVLPDNSVLQEIPVQIDIKPGDNTNPINLGAKGVVPVAIITTDDFDASYINPLTIVFASASPLKWSAEDINNDGKPDMIFHFNNQSLDLNENSTSAILTGQTTDGKLIKGTDLVKIVPDKKK